MTAHTPVRHLVLGALVSLSGCSDPAFPGLAAEDPCFSPVPRCQDRVEIAPRRYLPIFRTHDLEIGADGVVRAVIVVHGSGRDYDNYFERMIAAATLADERARTVIVAPHFQTAEDDPRLDEPFWTDSGWKKGHLSSTAGPSPRVSSYAALDEIVEILADASRFPDLEEIVVTGHSAGGQVTHRYAATGEPIRASLPLRYVVANPSTYLYLGEERAVGEGFALPDRDACPTYNEWHYGLEGRNSYSSRLTTEELATNLVERTVTIMVGTEDTGSAALDVSCGANLQGPHRYARGLTLMAYMSATFPGHAHEEVIVPGVAHSSLGMYTSPEGRAVIFR